MIWIFPGNFKAWVNNFAPVIESNDKNSLFNLAQQGINDINSAKELLNIFKYNFSYRSLKSTNEVATLVYESFQSWMQNGWFNEEELAPPSNNIPVQQPVKKTSSSYYDCILNYPNSSSKVYKTLINLRQACAHFSSIYTFKEAGSEMQANMNTAIKAVENLHNLICSLLGLPSPTAEESQYFMDKYLTYLIQTNDEVIFNHIIKAHSWYLYNIQNFSVEKSMELESIAGDDNIKLSELIMDFFGTPEDAITKNETHILKSSNDPFLQQFKKAMQLYLKDRGIDLRDVEPHQNSDAIIEDFQNTTLNNPNQGAGFI